MILIILLLNKKTSKEFFLVILVLWCTVWTELVLLSVAKRVDPYGIYLDIALINVYSM